ncbi:uncharacterized protein LOC112542731 isoform X2 [Python bivittatus]|uniref:Uncharacterized protein LOC112542731 isoform X2 n=1 Tax=Python bivittatus TaxID=176946 RepID=A0A9F5J0R8_PYTBI|nr:uncharacterized protein LOC112542731 isoform X2 [Python bivittatus]
MDGLQGARQGADSPFSMEGGQLRHGVRINMPSAHHPATNGEAERTHQVLQQYVWCYTTYSQDNWTALLPLAEFSCNNSVHSSIGMSPFQALYELPPSVKVHLVFHHSLLLKEAPPSPLRMQLSPPPPAVVKGEEEYEVEAILDSRRRGKGLQYLVHWKGYPEAEHSWENARNVHAPELVIDFHRCFPSKPKPPGTPAVNQQAEGGDSSLEEDLVGALGEGRAEASSLQPSTSSLHFVGGRGLILLMM